VAREIAAAQASIAHQGREQSRQRWLLGILLVSLVLAMLVASGMGAVHVPLRTMVESAIGFRPLSADQRVILLTAFVGSPYFLYLLRKARREVLS
jgi:ABC-type Fe3+-siderophore transport system permease subunit